MKRLHRCRLAAALAPYLSAVLAPLARAQTFDGPEYPVGVAPTSVAAGDLNGDGRPDLVTANSFSNRFSVLLSAAAGGYSPSLQFTVGANPQGIVLADFNLDGKLDAATANFGTNDASVRLGTG